MDKVAFYCTLYKIQADKDGETKIILVVPKSDAKQLMQFYAENTEKLISAGLAVVKENA